ncbi:MAG: 3-dehydroquinate dehydratase-2 [Myxococcota bacterium]|jgi:3-dehydroquinate dehydratase-2
MSEPLHITVLHGPNLNLLGQREPEIYGHATLAEVDAGLVAAGERLGAIVRTAQHNGEGALVEAIQACGTDGTAGIIINAAAYTHTSIAIRDALVFTGLPAVEVHISNVHARERFRHHSYLADVVVGQIVGLGVLGYDLALTGLLARLQGAQ